MLGSIVTISKDPHRDLIHVYARECLHEVNRRIRGARTIATLKSEGLARKLENVSLMKDEMILPYLHHKKQVTEDDLKEGYTKCLYLGYYQSSDKRFYTLVWQVER